MATFNLFLFFRAVIENAITLVLTVKSFDFTQESSTKYQIISIVRSTFSQVKSHSISLGGEASYLRTRPSG